ncbi:MAG: TonB-dependent receptor, partial [Gammaproteobacteria bacterium]|nr:TonB-dependent receptor [Gammaproteobacteria bacterium]
RDGPGGGVGAAIGLQYRNESMSVGGNDLATDPSFPFAFTGPSIPFSASDDVWAVFGELALPVTPDLELQLALRYEDYGGQTGDTLDPKFAFRWNAMDDLVFRGSIGTSFRGPSLFQRFGRSTGLQFMLPPSAEVIDANFGEGTAAASPFGSGVFARLPSFGNPELDPEKSTNFNIGVIWDATESLSFSMDYWNYRFKDVIIGDDARGLINDCQIQWQMAGRPDARVGNALNPDFLAVEACNFRNLDGDPSTPDIWLDTQGNPLNAQTSFTNGDKMKASGLDFLIRYSLATDYGLFSSTLDLSWFLEFEADRIVTPFDTRLDPGERVDLVGKSEAVLVARPLPEYKATLFNTWSRGNHFATLSVNYVSGVNETNFNDFKVKSHTTVDGSYTYNFERVDLATTVGIVNMFDEDPPQANGGFNGYAPTLHDPRGRLFYVRVRYGF